MGIFNRKKKKEEESIEFIQINLDDEEDIYMDEEVEDEEVSDTEIEDEEDKAEEPKEVEGSAEEVEESEDSAGKAEEAEDSADAEETVDSEDIELEEVRLDDEETGEETVAESELRKHKFRKKAAIISAGIFGGLVVIYLGFGIYFGSHFMFFTEINGRDYSMKNVSQVEEDMKQQVADYELTLEKSEGTEKIVGKDISLAYVPGDELKKLVKRQNNFLWITTLWNHPKLDSKVGVKYDAAALAEQVAKLSCMQPENQTASVNAHPEFQETSFVVVPEVVGTQIDVEKFNAALAEAISHFEEKLNLLESGSYLLPQFVANSPEVIQATESMNSYLGAEITYDFNPNTEIVNAATIAQWVKFNENMEVTFDEEAVKAYINSLAEKYDTKGRARPFTTATGNTVTVEGGHYGWRIDQEAEYAALTANIQNAEVVTREPAYSSRAASHGAMDVGSTYAEVDLTNQKAYFIKDGQVVLESDVVTGNPNKGNGTPQGWYSLTYKTRNAVLRGERRPDGTYSYESPVKYWMPFNKGIGFHDASWQSSFGGNRYRSRGSHGCVNMPTEKARQMYELISDGIPVVCHY